MGHAKSRRIVGKSTAVPLASTIENGSSAELHPALCEVELYILGASKEAVKFVDRAGWSPASVI
jgi:hypothetical protein